MNSKKPIIKVFLLAAFLVLPGIYCAKNPVTSNSDATLKIILSNKMNTKAIEPDISMTVATYNITGVDEDNNAMTPVTNIPVSQTSVEMEGLPGGLWTITVTGLNAAGTSIGSGTGTVNVQEDQNATVAITVIPFTGNGALELTASWDPDLFSTSPFIHAHLIPLGSSADDLTNRIVFTINSAQGTAAYSNSAISAGYYMLSLELTDSSGLVNYGGAADVVRIASGRTSSGTISLVLSDHGVIIVTISQQMNEPVIVALSGTQSSITSAESMTVTASVSNATVAAYYWYIDGGIINSATGAASFTVSGSTLAAGQHRIDVLAVTSDNLRAGSVSYIFTVTD